VPNNGQCIINPITSPITNISYRLATARWYAGHVFAVREALVGGQLPRKYRYIRSGIPQ
jgi:hypothetical protein